ncbi:hypothetical protein [Loigolactobacillus binensis]|uniref:PepSY domain-containing protein n=1 Tax=Loigolactobacillus binensis TaxID=2559922 RepID=A0ABW3E7B7_9LACO|nr:hypothetical protein [Loigolactobacillus binensis]
MSHQTTVKFTSGTLLLLASGVLSQQLWRTYRGAQPQRLLKQLKHELRQQGTITGAWIEFTPRRYRRHWVYRGGITQAGQPRREYRFLITPTGHHIGYWRTLNA